MLGHESAGRVVAVGERVTQARASATASTLEPGLPCGRCRECRAGAYNLCRDVRFLGAPPTDGAFTRYLAMHEDFAHALPDGLSDEAGALMEPLSVALWACERAGVSAGDRVLVTGAGPIGLLSAQVARARGATEIVVTDVNRHRLELALRHGATRAVEAGEQPPEADALIECSGHPQAMHDGIAALRPAGTAVLVGMGGGDDASVPLSLHPDARDLAQRHVPLRQHLPGCDRARRLRRRRRRGDRHRSLRARRGRRPRCGPSREDPQSVKPIVTP